MLNKFAAALLLAALAAGAATAHGSGSSPGAMPGISYTDMPAYAQKPSKPAWRQASKHWGYSTSR